MLRMQLHSWKPARRLTKEGMTVTAETVYQELSDGHFIVIVLFPFKGLEHLLLCLFFMSCCSNPYFLTEGSSKPLKKQKKK